MLDAVNCSRNAAKWMLVAPSCMLNADNRVLIAADCLSAAAKSSICFSLSAKCCQWYANWC